jgi:hypothetical protein
MTPNHQVRSERFSVEGDDRHKDNGSRSPLSDVEDGTHFKPHGSTFNHEIDLFLE